MRALKFIVAAAAVAAGLLIAPRSALALYENTYFPLSVGSEWTYAQGGTGASAQSVVVKVAAQRTDPVRGYIYFQLSSFNGASHWVRQTSTGRVYEATSREWYRFASRPGSAAWTFSIAGDAIACSSGARVQVVSTSERVTVGAGTFSTIHFRFTSRCRDAGITDEWFARGVGLVKRQTTSIAGPRTLSLVRYSLGGATPAPTPAPTPANGPFGVSGTIASSRVTLKPILSQGLNKPMAMAFHPTDGSLWIVNYGDDSSVVVDKPGTASQRARKYVDHSDHFMNNPTAIAFSRTRNEMATTQDTTNDYNSHAAHGNMFMGPTLWTADRRIYTGDADTHLDMLHHSPQAMGIESGEARARDQREYWVFNGQSGSIDRYFFNQPHALGADDHSDGLTYRYGSGLRRVAGVPSHLALDTTTGLLYFSDTGNGRLASLDTRQSIANARPIGSHHPETPLYGVSGARIDAVTTSSAGLSRPAGLVLSNGHLVVADHATGKIKAFTTAGRLVGEVDTGLGANAITGLAAAPSGTLYLLDSRGGRALEMQIR